MTAVKELNIKKYLQKQTCGSMFRDHSKFNCQLTRKINSWTYECNSGEAFQTRKNSAELTSGKIFFSDEKMFVLEQQLNVQND
jgi:hypothetical protein